MTIWMSSAGLGSPAPAPAPRAAGSREPARRGRESPGGLDAWRSSDLSLEHDLDAQARARIVGGQRGQRGRGDDGPKSGAVHEGEPARGHDARIGHRAIALDLKVDDRSRLHGLGGAEPVEADDQDQALDVDGILEVRLIELEPRRFRPFRPPRRRAPVGRAAAASSPAEGRLTAGVAARPGRLTEAASASSCPPWPAGGAPSSRAAAGPPRVASRSWAWAQRPEVPARRGRVPAPQSSPPRASGPRPPAVARSASGGRGSSTIRPPRTPAWSTAARIAAGAQGSGSSLRSARMLPTASMGVEPSAFRRQLEAGLRSAPRGRLTTEGRRLLLHLGFELPEVSVIIPRLSMPMRLSRSSVSITVP